MRNSSLFVVTAALIIFTPTPAPCLQTEPTAPGYKLNRADEDYRYLQDPAQRSDLWDPIKFLAIQESPDWYLSFGGEARERFEYFDNPNWGSGPQGSGYFLQRYFLHGDLHLGEHARLFGQLQSSLENGRRGGPRGIDKDELDLHQGFLDLKWQAATDHLLTLRSGRQELAYGSQRLISVREGPNVRQSFDGFRVMYHAGDLSVHGFATRPKQTRRYVFDDATDHEQGLWGLYSVLPLPSVSAANIDLYYLGIYRHESGFDQGTAHETRHSIGTRLWRSKRPLDYNFEFVYQWGSFGRGDIRAWTAASDTGYQFTAAPLAPRLGLRADIASGDRDPNDADLQTFNPLFPKGAYFSENGLIGPANFINFNPSVELHFPRGVTVMANWDFFWRESTRDGIYNNSVDLVRSGQSSTARYIGSQPQVQVECDLDRHLALVAIYAHFLAGPFLRESGPGKDVNFVASWVTYKF